MRQQPLQQSIQLILSQKVDPYDDIVDCLKLSNHSLDLRDFYRLITKIEQLENTTLRKWKNNWTTKFLKDLQSKANTWSLKQPKLQGRYLEIARLSNFHAYVSLYDTWAQEDVKKLSSEEAKFLVQFFEFQNSTDLRLVSDPEEIKNEFQGVTNTKLVNAARNYGNGIIDLLQAGVKAQEMQAYFDSSLKVYSKTIDHSHLPVSFPSYDKPLNLSESTQQKVSYPQHLKRELEFLSSCEPPISPPLLKKLNSFMKLLLSKQIPTPTFLTPYQVGNPDIVSMEWETPFVILTFDQSDTSHDIGTRVTVETTTQNYILPDTNDVIIPTLEKFIGA